MNRPARPDVNDYYKAKRGSTKKRRSDPQQPGQASTPASQRGEPADEYVNF
jgi:hypothetical protein